MQSARRLLNYNVYFASLYTFLKLRYQPRLPSSAVKKFISFSIVPSVGLAKVDSWSPIGKPKPEEKEAEVELFGIRLHDKQDVNLLKDILAADKIYEDGDDSKNDFDTIYELLNKHGDKKEPELLWRLARITYERAKKMTVAKERNEALESAFAMVKTSLELDEENFAAHKWMAILLNEISLMKSLKEQILQSETVKKHMLRATELNPSDPTSIYLLGAWCFSVAEVPWYQRKAAEAFIAKPPTCEFKEAVQHFLRAEDARPLFYSMNLLMLAKSYIQIRDYDNAHKYLLKLKKFPVRSEEDFDAKKEAISLLSSYKSYFGKETKIVEEAAKTEILDGLAEIEREDEEDRKSL